MDSIGTERMARYFMYVSLVNALAAALFTTPILVPTFGIPLIAGIFPGTWTLIAYLAFLAVGVMGMVGWSAMYYLTSRLLGKKNTTKTFAIMHLVIVEVSVYGFATLMSAAGWIGGQALRQGLAVAAVGFLIEWLILPTGAFVGLVVFGQVLGILNIINTIRSKVSEIAT
ncbi:MAG: hypothetical protein FJ358_02795 [Thaumarchaeota archaeon]|nr:hypothetical protein [Nitrososphaerota archaeon]